MLLMTTCAVKADAFEAVGTQQKVFKSHVDHRYREQLYKAKPLVLVTKPLLGNQGPDRALLNLLSAMNAKDYDWWLSTWDKASLAALQANLKTAKKGLEALRREWVSELGGKQVLLSRWVETSGFVMVTYKLQEPKKPKQLSEEKAYLFILENGLWKASNKFSDNRFVAAVLAGQTKLAYTVR